MSDCSAAAMLPKEPPRTCGACGHSCGHRTRLYGCVYDYVPCLLHGTFEHEESSCSDWELRWNGRTLEQRCRQLELVAWKMLEYIKGKYIPFMPCTDQYAIQEFTRMLKDLGVSVDD